MCDQCKDIPEAPLIGVVIDRELDILIEMLGPADAALMLRNMNTVMLGERLGVKTKKSKDIMPAEDPGEPTKGVN